ncbi:MAG: hypothetical protein LBF50_07315 [Azoarcus sp.]|jgi:hypothetical protein|nr:hypothetical protein [Azoarcus sp.]
MKTNRHQTAIPQETITQINTQIDAISAQIAPHAIILTAQERRDILKMGDKSLAFVRKAHEYAHSHPALVPGYMDLADFDIDFADANNLLGLLSRLKEVAQQIEDTAMIAGSEAFEAALAFYSNVREAARRNVSGAEIVNAELKERYQARRRGKSAPEGEEQGS